MKISDLLRPPDYTPYVELPKPPEGWPPRDSLPALRKSLDKAHDNLKHVVRENDRLRAASLALYQEKMRSDRRHKWQLRILYTLIGLTWAAIWGLLQWLIPYAIHGMAR